MSKLYLNNHIVLHDRRLAFKLVPKCAASSIRAAVQNVGGNNQLGQATVPADYHRIAVVRNTWDRLVSCWYQKTKDPNRLYQLRNSEFYHDMPFAEFLELVARDPLANHHYYPQDLIVEPYDEVWFLRHLTQQWAQRFPDIPLQHLNGSAHKHYSEYYFGRLRDIVGEVYASEINRFGFTFW